MADIPRLWQRSELMSQALAAALVALSSCVGSAESEAPDLSQLNQANLESHCNQGHAHWAPGRDHVLPEAWGAKAESRLSGCDWQGQLNWCEADTGFNEGAEEGARLAANGSLGLPDNAAGATGALLGNLWKRREMISFAKEAAKAGNAQATAIAISCQWHNCQAFACLLAHPAEVRTWLLR